MRFSVDAHAIGQHLTGNEVYVRNLLRSFDALDRHAEFIAYVSRPEAAAAVPARFRCRRVAANPYFRLGLDLSAKLRRDRPDLVHVQYTAPLRCPAPVVVSIHDVSYLEHPEYFPPTKALQLRLTVRWTVARAARILTPSEFSRQGILQAYRLPEEKVVVVPNAVSRDFRPLEREAAAAEVRRQYGIAAPYILSVGDLQPRKNQAGLIAAFEELLRRHPELPHHLVLVGKPGWGGARVRRRAMRSPVSHRIHFTGFVPDEQLRYLYGGCEVFVFPSFYEGFGLPILEAMASGRAVACSNTTAIPEVADAAALVFNPHSKEQMVLALRDLLLDAELRQHMERLGLQRAAAYSWRHTARKTLEAYYEVAGAGAAVSSLEPVKKSSVFVSPS